jgi:hypothetical protein
LILNSNGFFLIHKKRPLSLSFVIKFVQKTQKREPLTRAGTNGS